MRVLVTGAAGFIGFHTARLLCERGAEAVLGLDDLNPYYDPAIKRARLAALAEAAGAERFRFEPCDVCDPERLGALWRGFEPTHVLHLAAQAGVRYSLDAPLAYIQANVVGFQHVLELVRETRPQSFVYASSSSVYGGANEPPFREDQDVTSPWSLYAATKVANEAAARAYTNLFGLPSVGLRFFTAYGPLGRPDMAVWRFAERMLAGEPIPVYNRGVMQRDFTYVDDVANGTIAALETGGQGVVYNLGRGEPVALMDMIRCLEHSLGVEARLDLLPMQPGDVPATLADIARARRDLGYDPQVSLAEGIDRFCAWFRSWRAR